MERARFIELDFLPRTGFSDQRAGQRTPDPVARVQRMMVSDIPKATRLEYALVLLCQPHATTCRNAPYGAALARVRVRNHGREYKLTVLRRHDRMGLGHRCLVVASSGSPIWRRALLIREWDDYCEAGVGVSLIAFRMTQETKRTPNGAVTGTEEGGRSWDRWRKGERW